MWTFASDLWGFPGCVVGFSIHDSVTSCECLIGRSSGPFDGFLDVSQKCLCLACPHGQWRYPGWPAVMSMSILGYAADLNTRSQPKNGRSLHFSADACVAQRCWWSNTRKSFHTSAGPDLKWLSRCCQWPLFREAKMEIYVSADEAKCCRGAYNRKQEWGQQSSPAAS